MSKCCIANCDNNMECPSSGTCKACYQNILNWSKRSAKDIQERASRLGKYNSRMSTFLPANVEMFSGKTKIKAMPGKIRLKKPKTKIKSKRRHVA